MFISWRSDFFESFLEFVFCGKSEYLRAQSFYKFSGGNNHSAFEMKPTHVSRRCKYCSESSPRERWTGSRRMPGPECSNRLILFVEGWIFFVCRGSYQEESSFPTWVFHPWAWEDYLSPPPCPSVPCLFPSVSLHTCRSLIIILLTINTSSHLFPFSYSHSQTSYLPSSGCVPSHEHVR